MDTRLKTLLAGEFTQTLAHVEVRQCGAATPIIYRGPGTIRQGAKGELLLQILDTSHIDETEKFKRAFDNGPGFGKLVPEEGYFDVEATDNAGNQWGAKRQSVECRFGQGVTQVEVELTRWDRSEERRVKRLGNGKSWWIPRTFDLPWNEKAQIEGMPGFSKFVGTGAGCSWEAAKSKQGVHIEFWAEAGDIDFLSTRFRRGLEILCGQSLDPRITDSYDTLLYTETLHRPRQVYDRLKGLAPLRRRVVADAPAANHFLSQFLALRPRENGKGDPARVIYAFWHRILRALHEDIENASLTLSVAIEGVIKNVFAPQKTADPEFIAALHQAIEALGDPAVHTRAIGVLSGKLEQADHFPPARFLHEARKAGWLTVGHVDAWEIMRNKGAHGELLEDDSEALQAHIDRFHTGLETFYRLMFHAIDYQGPHFAYGLAGVPTLRFPPGATSVPTSEVASTGEPPDGV